MSDSGKLFLIPNTLGEVDVKNSLPSGITEQIKDVLTYFVEHPKQARRLLIGLGLKGKLDDIEMISMKNGLKSEDKSYASELLMNGEEIGIICDAGCPAIADPGYQIVGMAHNLKVKIIPFIGPSSILLGLMASGFNGQNFAFHGYLPKEPERRKKKIRDIENDVYKKNQTQIFIETPYRNEYLFNDLLSTCQKKTKICLAVDLTTPDESIRVMTTEEWRKIELNINKKQCLFLIYK